MSFPEMRKDRSGEENQGFGFKWKDVSYIHPSGTINGAIIHNSLKLK